MGLFKFSQIFVVGNGRVAKEAQKIASDHFKQDVILCDEIRDEFFAKIKNALIISANNFYIFKKEAVRQNTIINYHNALLPKHRGTKAHVWAIYEGDEESGISWHLADEGLDMGRVLVQEKIKFDEKITAKDLLLTQHKLAINSLKNALYALQNENFINTKGKGSYHKKISIPNDGVLKLSWNFKKISRFLRAFDVGAFREGLPLPKLEIFGEKRDVIFYEINNENLSLNLGKNLNLTIKRT